MSVLARPAGLLGLVAGFLVWSSAFLVLYGLHALGCAYGWQAGALRAALVATWAVHLALAAGLVVLAGRLARGAGGAGGRAFVGRASLVLTIAALVATAWTGVPVILYPLCA